MFVLRMRRDRYTWIVAGRGSLEECRQMEIRWIALGYTGETKITAGR
jgi:hypothetical protein